MKEMKLELERIYKEYCLEDLNALEGEEFIDSLKGFMEFRLFVSGGSESSMGSIGCGTVEGFLNELFCVLMFFGGFPHIALDFPLRALKGLFKAFLSLLRPFTAV